MRIPEFAFLFTLLLISFEFIICHNHTVILKTPSGTRELDLVDDVINVPQKRPRTPVNKDRERILRPVRIIPNQSPCMYQRYLEFFRETQDKNGSTFTLDFLMKTTITIDGQEFYHYDPEDVCIVVEDDLTIDYYSFDCAEAEVCVCGLYMGYVDPNVHQPDASDGEKRYLAVNGLDRKLVEEDGICVSGLKGHCTMENSSALEKLDCNTLYECVLDDSYGPILRNKKTDETYGICLPKPFSVPFADNHILYENLNHSVVVRLSIVTLMSTSICLILLHHD